MTRISSSVQWSRKIYQIFRKIRCRDREFADFFEIFLKIRGDMFQNLKFND